MKLFFYLILQIIGISMGVGIVFLMLESPVYGVLSLPVIYAFGGIFFIANALLFRANPISKFKFFVKMFPLWFTPVVLTVPVIMLYLDRSPYAQLIIILSALLYILVSWAFTLVFSVYIEQPDKRYLASGFITLTLHVIAIVIITQAWVILALGQWP